MTRDIRRKEINWSARNLNSYVESFPGATSEDMQSYVIRTSKRNPDYLIIHCETNDSRTDEREEIERK